MIPKFDSAGLLPKGVHRADWDEVVKRFGGNLQRRQLLKGLEEALELLRQAGCRRVYLDGQLCDG